MTNPKHQLNTDNLGQIDIPESAMWGAHTQRALENFPATGLPISKYFYKALSQVKLAAAITNKSLGYLDEDISKATIEALEEMCDGKYFEHFVVDPIQGGAGTSTNMNINEIAATRANQILDLDTDPIDPLLHINLHQSTNDVYPTALKITIYYYLQDLEESVNELLVSFQEKEAEFAGIVKISRTELMPAVPYTLGKEFSAYSDAIGRDRWRIFKCQERIRQINLGGTAIGTGIAAPKKYIFRAANKLKEITGLPISRAENMVDATQNHDQIAEVFGMLKVLALNLEKISNDLRLLSSFEEIIIPVQQVGSSIMPGKYNPVILEMVSLMAKKVIGNELSASLAISKGELELNAFLPLVAYEIFESCDMMRKAIDLMKDKCIIGLKANEDVCQRNLMKSPASSTILLPLIGYHKATEVAKYMTENSVDLKTAALKTTDISEDKIDQLLKPERICALGYDEPNT